MNNVTPLFKPVKLRDYQQAPVDAFFKEKKNLLCHLPTGSGKGEIIVEIIKRAKEEELSAVVLVRRIDLVRNLTKRLRKYGIKCGVLQGKKRVKNPNLTICSIDTLHRIPAEKRPSADIIIIDEAHDACSDTYKDVLEGYKTSKKFSLTATPYRREGLSHLADEIIRPAAYMDLVDQGYLARSKTFAPFKPDLEKVATIAGEFSNADLYRAYNQNTIIQKIVDVYKQYLNGKSAVLFAVNISISKRICEVLIDSGIPALHLDNGCDEQERETAIKQLEDGEIKVICNVNLFSTGVDIPSLESVVMCRPTKSRILFTQQAGRGSRVTKDKKEFTLLDLAGNVERFGILEFAPQGWLNPIIEEKESDIDNEALAFECPECSHVFMPKKPVECPECGWTKKVEDSDQALDESLSKQKVELFEIDTEHKAYQEIRAIATLAHSKGYKPGAVYYRVLKTYGKAIAKKYFKYEHRNEIYEIFSDYNQPVGG